MAPLAGLTTFPLHLHLVGHGGVAGAIAESLVVIAISAALVAVWIRERRSGRASEGPARLRDEDEG
jgi:hypothetical protein